MKCSCHDTEVVGSNNIKAKLGVYSPSVNVQLQPTKLITSVLLLSVFVSPRIFTPEICSVNMQIGKYANKLAKTDYTLFISCSRPTA